MNEKKEGGNNNALLIIAAILGFLFFQNGLSDAGQMQFNQATFGVLTSQAETLGGLSSGVNQLSSGMEGLEGRFAAQDNNMRTLLNLNTQSASQIGDLTAAMNGLTSQVGSMYRQVGQIDTRVGDMDGRLGKLEADIALIKQNGNFDLGDRLTTVGGN